MAAPQSGLPDVEGEEVAVVWFVVAELGDEESAVVEEEVAEVAAGEDEVVDHLCPSQPGPAVGQVKGRHWNFFVEAAWLEEPGV